MKHFSLSTFTVATILAVGMNSASAETKFSTGFDLTKHRYQIDSPSVFHNRHARDINKINNLVESKKNINRAPAIENPKPLHTFAPATQVGNIDAPNGELWYYTGEFDYLEIPPHDNVYFTDRILQEYTFYIYDSDMKPIGTIKDKMDYAPNEVRVPLCELTPIATRNFFNTDDKIELMVALAVNIEGGGNNYRSVVYTLDGKKDAEGFDEPIMVMDDLVGDVIEGPSTDGSDNFYLAFMRDVFEPEEGAGESFWDYLLAQKAEITVYGKAIDDNGPRALFETIIPLIQLPGDQQDVPAMMSMRRGDDVIYSVSYYKEPFYNRYDDPFSEEMTMREGNELIIDLYKVTESSFTKFSTTEIPMTLDPMKDADGNPTVLFSFYSIGNLRFHGDILFDAPGATAEAPEFIVTRGNYQVSSDAIVPSYFTYNNDGTLKNTLFEYADGSLSLGDLEGFEPQQVFVSKDAFGYLYNFVDIYSAKTSTVIEAEYYYDDDSDSELLTANVARYAIDDTYKYVFELRYPLVDENENDILRFIYINRDGSYDTMEYVNMGTGIAYAQSYLSTEALAPHAYSTSDNPVFMMLVKRGIEGSEAKIEELMIAEAETDEHPEGKTLLQVGPEGNNTLASIVPEFPVDDKFGRLFIYYVDTDSDKYILDIYNLPLEEVPGGNVQSVTYNQEGLAFDGKTVYSAGEIKVYTIFGTLVATGLDSADLSTLGAGVYLINAGGKSFKILK